MMSDFIKAMQVMQSEPLATKPNDKRILAKKNNITRESIELRKLNAEKDIIFYTSVDLVTSEQTLEFYDKLNSSEKYELMHKTRVDASLDLHKLTVEQAKNAVEKFLFNAKNNSNARFLEIVHGKASKQSEKYNEYPVLKNEINSMLRNHRLVKGFCSQKMANGLRNPGSVILLLNI